MNSLSLKDDFTQFAIVLRGAHALEYGSMCLSEVVAPRENAVNTSVNTNLVEIPIVVVKQLGFLTAGDLYLKLRESFKGLTFEEPLTFVLGKYL